MIRTRRGIPVSFIVVAGLVPAIRILQRGWSEFPAVRRNAGMTPERSAALLMPEVPCAGEDHGDALVVGRLDHLIVAH